MNVFVYVCVHMVKIPSIVMIETQNRYDTPEQGHKIQNYVHDSLIHTHAHRIKEMKCTQKFNGEKHSYLHDVPL